MLPAQQNKMGMPGKPDIPQFGPKELLPQKLSVTPPYSPFPYSVSSALTGMSV